ncbi:hypothetical protein BMS3Bbin10_02098 [bacterium BMS3Bbin10]|nr:hypothetical protein BMS3Bbin10_02098 [bacterium BMS3Bbin10]
MTYPRFARVCAGAAHKRRAAARGLTVSVKNKNGLAEGGEGPVEMFGLAGRP